MTKKKLTARQKKEISEIAALRMRLHDMASGAGFDEIDEVDYWCHTNECLVRLIASVDDAFGGQTEGIGYPSGQLTNYWSLSNYDSLEELTTWLYRAGYRA
ncbi:MAG: hypothetical protein COB36_10895 [Alphaproteobacteria bacterium]|nr:MAG: hypothetical protein COB36_10895 [Alphaproteobacteria bacterium]